MTQPNVEVIDIAPGLWIWRLEHPHWREGHDWQQVVTSVCVDAGGERWVIDPLLPPENATDVWDRFAEKPPTAAAVVIPDHMRETWDNQQTWSVDVLARRYGCHTFGPNAFDPGMVEALGPVQTDVQKIVPQHELPGGILPFRDPRGWHETPLYLPQQRTLVFGDSLTERAGSLRVWMSPTHEERAVPDLRAMLEFPFERVIISHGEPVHTRAAFEQALERTPWPATSLHIAAWSGDFDQVRKLVGAGADLMARSENSDETPLDWAVNASRLEWARKATHDDIIAYLESAMAANRTNRA